MACIVVDVTQVILVSILLSRKKRRLEKNIRISKFVITIITSLFFIFNAYVIEAMNYQPSIE